MCFADARVVQIGTKAQAGMSLPWLSRPLPSGLSGPLLYLRGCTGLRSPPDQLTELMDSWRMAVDLGAPTSPYHSLCFSPNKHHIVELRMGAPPFGLAVFAR